MNNFEKFKSIEGYAQFRSECKLVDLKAEYPGWKENVKYGVITTLSLNDIEQKYPDVYVAVEPLLLLPVEYDEVRLQYDRNEHKHERYKGRFEDRFIDIDERDMPCFETDSSSGLDGAITNFLIKELLNCLNKEERFCIEFYVVRGYSMRDIAKLLKWSPRRVHRTIKRSINRMRIKGIQNGMLED